MSSSKPETFTDTVFSEKQRTTNYINLHIKMIYTHLGDELDSKLKDPAASYTFNDIAGDGTITRKLLDKHFKILRNLEDANVPQELMEIYCELGEAFVINSIKSYPSNQHLYLLFIEAVKRILRRSDGQPRRKEIESSSSDEETNYSSTDVSRKRGY